MRVFAIANIPYLFSNQCGDFLLRDTLEGEWDWECHTTRLNTNPFKKGSEAMDLDATLSEPEEDMAPDGIDPVEVFFFQPLYPHPSFHFYSQHGIQRFMA